MVDIVSFLHAYVPGHDEASSESNPVKVLSERDYLPLRHNEAQSEPCNTQGILLQDWKALFQRQRTFTHKWSGCK
jgi:hypothetical protein